MTDQKTILTTYLQRVLALKDRRRRVPSAEELEDIAKELGLSEADLAAVAQAAEDHTLRGRGFMRRGRWDDAITELEEAVALSPRDVERLHALARAHAGKWQEGGEATSRERAERLARECLDLDPLHGGSFDVLELLDQAPARPEPPPARKSRRSLLISSLVLTALLGGSVLLRTRPEPEPPPAAVPETATALSVDSRAEPAAEPPEGAEELDLPIELDLGDSGLELELELRRSRLQIYADGKSFLTLNALLANRGITEIDKLGARLLLLDAAGATLAQEAFDAVSASDPVLRPGDRHAMHRLLPTSADVRGARLAIESVDQNPAAETYPPAKPIPLDGPDPGSDVAITLRERSYQFSDKSFADDGSGYFDAVLEIENTSGRTLRRLTLKAEITGPDESWSKIHESHVVLTSGPALHPGEIRLKRLFLAVEGRPESYRMSVVDLR